MVTHWRVVRYERGWELFRQSVFFCRLHDFWIVTSGEVLERLTPFSKDPSMPKHSCEDFQKCEDKQKKKMKKNRKTQQEKRSELEKSPCSESYSNDLFLEDNSGNSSTFLENSTVTHPSDDSNLDHLEERRRHKKKKKKHHVTQLEGITELEESGGIEPNSIDSFLVQPSVENFIDERKKHKKKKKKNQEKQKIEISDLEKSCELEPCTDNLSSGEKLDGPTVAPKDSSMIQISDIVNLNSSERMSMENSGDWDYNVEKSVFLKGMKEFMMENDFEKEEYSEIIELLQQQSTPPESYEKLLSSLEIRVNWVVAPTHLVETRITKKPTADQEKELYLLNKNMKKGKFLPDEDKIIKQNWEKFSKEYLIPNPQAFIKLSVGNRPLLKQKEKIKFVQYLGRKLDHRSLYNIYERFRSLYSTESKCWLSAADKNLLKKHVKLYGNRYSDLTDVLLKRKRYLYKTTKKLTSKYKGKSFGSIVDKENLLKAVLQVTNSDTFEEVNGKKIDWAKVGVILKCKSDSCKEYWMRKLSAYLCVRGVIFETDVNCKILESLKEMNVNYSQQVDWAVVTKNVYNLPPSFLWYTFWKLCSKFRLKYLGEHWKESLEELLEQYYEKVKGRRFTGRIMPSMKLVDGKLVDRLL